MVSAKACGRNDVPDLGASSWGTWPRILGSMVAEFRGAKGGNSLSNFACQENALPLDSGAQRWEGGEGGWRRTSHLTTVTVGLLNYLKKADFLLRVWISPSLSSRCPPHFKVTEQKKRTSGAKRDNSNETKEKNEPEHSRMRKVGKRIKSERRKKAKKEKIKKRKKRRILGSSKVREI